MYCDNPIYFTLSAKSMTDVSFTNSGQSSFVDCSECEVCVSRRKQTSDRVRRFRLKHKESSK